MTIFQESKGWDSELPIFNRWCLVLALAFKMHFYSSLCVILLEEVYRACYVKTSGATVNKLRLTSSPPKKLRMRSSRCPHQLKDGKLGYCTNSDLLPDVN